MAVFAASPWTASSAFVESLTGPIREAGTFLPRQKPARWSGVRDCTDRGHLAPQHINPNPSAYTKYVGWNNYRGGMSEDCLVVNVWTPALRDNGKRPVMFIIHGGGYTSGSGNLEALEGQHLAKLANMVVVTVNHRLGMLGFADLSGFGGDELRNSGNVGMLDLVMALEWVRDNIGQFGGNPQSVTITGQSGGGGKCSHLMAMPSARRLFHKVAIQSGSTLKTGRHEDRRKDAERLCTKLGVATGEFAKLQSVAFRDIVDNQANAGPVLDSNAVPRDPFDPDAPAISAAVPMIIGTCLNDAGFTITDTSDDEASLRKWVENQLASSESRGKGGRSARVIPQTLSAGKRIQQRRRETSGAAVGLCFCGVCPDRQPESFQDSDLEPVQRVAAASDGVQLRDAAAE